MELLATLSFQPEAYDSAAQFFRCLIANGPRVGGWRDNSGQGYTVHVVPTEGEPFDAEAVDLRVGEDGQWKLVVAEWDDEAHRGDRTRLRTFDIYDELKRIEVL